MQQPTVYAADEQTPAQRQHLIDIGRSWVVAQGVPPGPEAEAVYARYVAGELTLQGVTDELVSFYRNRAASKQHQPAAQPSTARPPQMQPEQLELV